MKHWDLIPKETVRLVPPGGEHVSNNAPREHGIALVFQFRDTRSAFFTSPRDPRDWIELTLRTDGDLIDGAGHKWEIATRRANTRFIAEEPLGEFEHGHFTAAGGRL
jgi:hypothetical protein